MANKKEFIAHYLTYGKTDSWENLAKQFSFNSGEALRSFVKRNRHSFALERSEGNIIPDIKNTTKVLDCFSTKYKVCYDRKLTEESTNRETGEQILTYESDKPLSPDEIDELAQVDNITRVVTRTWLKSTKNNTWTYSICTKLIDKTPVEKCIDYKKEFEEFLSQKVKGENIPKFQVSNKIKDTKNALVLSLSDLHFDKLAYAEESGEDGNMDTQRERALSASIDLIDRAVAAHKIEVIYIIGGNDMLHANSAANTTQKGTPLDVDNRWNTSFKRALSLLTDIIEYAKQYSFVEYITVLGNHSPEREFYLSIALEAFYRNDENVIVETVNNVRKYFRYGNSTFMLSHEFGNKEKDLPVIFAIENSKDFAECKYKFILSGHIHSKKETMFVGTHEQYGILHKVMPSLSTTDKWHHENMYIGNQKSCIALVINAKYGEIAELVYNV